MRGVKNLNNKIKCLLVEPYELPKEIKKDNGKSNKGIS